MNFCAEAPGGLCAQVFSNIYKGNNNQRTEKVKHVQVVIIVAVQGQNMKNEKSNQRSSDTQWITEKRSGKGVMKVY